MPDTHTESSAEEPVAQGRSSAQSVVGCAIILLYAGMAGYTVPHAIQMTGSVCMGWLLGLFWPIGVPFLFGWRLGS